MDHSPTLSVAWRNVVAVLLLMAAGVLVYSNTFQSPFVFDDINFITRNDPHVHMTAFSWGAIKEAALEGQPRHRYLPNISFAVNYYFGRENPFGYHLVNLGTHILTGIFLFFCLRPRFFFAVMKKSGGCLLSNHYSSLFFLIGPLFSRQCSGWCIRCRPTP